MTGPTLEREIIIKMIKAIAFDLDDTLWSVEPVIKNAEAKITSWVYRKFPDLVLNRSEMATYRSEILKREPELGFRYTEMRRRILKEIFRSYTKDSQAAETLSHQAMAVFIKTRSEVEYYPGVESTLADLSTKFLLGTLTNGNANVKKMKISKYFDFSFSAEDVGAPKPEPEMFLRALQHTGLAGREVVYVGDDPINDVDGAKNAGLLTIWKKKGETTSGGVTNPDATISQINELPDVIDELNLLQKSE